MKMKQSKFQWRLVFVSLSVAFGSNFAIYSTSVINNPKDIVIEWLNESISIDYHQMSSSLLAIVWTVFVSAVYLAATIGSLLTRALAESMGRRKALMFVSSLNIVGGILSGVSVTLERIELLFVGRLILGCAIGIGFGLSSMFLTEIAPIEYRGACASSQQIFVGLGDLFAFVLTLPQFLGTRRIALLFQCICGLVEFTTLIFCPESPRYLYMVTKDYEGVTSALMFYHGPERVKEALEELAIEESDEIILERQKPKIGELFRRSYYRKPLLLALAMTLLIPASCQGPMAAYSTYLMINTGLETMIAMYATCGTGVVGIIGGLFSLVFVEKYGRRVMLIGGMTLALICLLLMTLFTGLNQFGIHRTWISYTSIGVLMIFAFASAVSISVLLFVTSELFSQQSRSTVVGIVSATRYTVNTIAMFVYWPMQDSIGVSLSYIPFIVSLSFIILFIYYKLPETTNRNIQTITQGFRKLGLNQNVTDLTVF